MMTKNRIQRKWIPLILSLCVLCTAFWRISFAAAADVADAALSSLSYSVNGGSAVEVPDFDPANKGPYWVPLSRSVARDAQIALTGEPSGNAQITGTKEATLVYGANDYDQPAQITVTLPGGTPQTYTVHFYIEPLYTYMEDTSLAGITEGETFTQNERPLFTALGPGMEGGAPVDGDSRIRPVSWKVDGGALSGQWSGAPYTGSLNLMELSPGRHTLDVQYVWESFTQVYENNRPTGEYGWIMIEELPPEEMIKTVSFMVTPAPAIYTVTFDSRGGSAVSPLTGVRQGETIAAPTPPTRDGYTFGGWYRDVACTGAWDFKADTVAADITLYAKWTTGGGPNDGTGPNASPATGDSVFPLAAAALALAFGCIILGQASKRRDTQ